MLTESLITNNQYSHVKQRHNKDGRDGDRMVVSMQDGKAVALYLP